MKKINYILELIIFSILLSNLLIAQPVKRVLFEVITDAGCDTCGLYGNQLMTQILDNYPDRIIGVAIHQEDVFRIPLASEISILCRYPIPCAAADRNFNVIASDIGVVKGQVFVEREFWDTIVKAALQKPAKVDIKLFYTIDKDSGQLKSDIEATFYEAMSGDFRFNVIITEDDLIAPQSGASEVYQHNNILRDMLGGSWGTSGVIDSSISQGQKFMFTYNYALDTSWNVDNLHVIGLVQEAGLSESGGVFTNKVRILNSVLGNDITSIENSDADVIPLNLKAVPNPCTDYVNIQFNNQRNSEVIIEISNILGENKGNIFSGFKESGLNTITYNTSNLSSGIYFIKLFINGQFTVLKIMKI